MANYIGTSGNDYIVASSYADWIQGNNGDDTIFAGAGNDIVGGNAGDDQLYGQDGDDEIWDTSGNNWISGGNGDDYIVTGGGNDTLYGNAGNDYLQCGDGNDQVHGGAGNDHIRAVVGYNDVSGGEGQDLIDFSASAHRVYGDLYGGNDDFQYADEFRLVSWHENVDLTNAGQVGDVIGDFQPDLDVLNLAYLGIQASSVTIGTYQNGYMVHIDTGTNQLDIGVRTGVNGALTMNDIVTA